MNYKIINGAISYGAETILEEINFEIKEKEKIAIVGKNGSGKTTLLKAILENEMLEEGIGENKFGVYKQGNPIIGHLKQIEFENEVCFSTFYSTRKQNKLSTRQTTRKNRG